MKYLNFPLFMSMSFMGMIITMNSSSWLSAWMGMELNILGFLPMILSQKNSLTHESIMKYFLMSSISSMIILFFSLVNLSIWIFNSYLLNNLLISLALAMKLGAAPFHYWFVSMLGNLHSISAFWLMTFQSMPPLFMLNFVLSNFMIFMLIFFSSIFGSLGGFNQNSVMKLMAYSSISHIAWLLIGLLYMNKLCLIYFFLYTFMMIPILYFIGQFSIFQMSEIFNLPKSLKFWFFFSLLSLSGFPPLLGFFPKLFILINLYIHKQYFFSLFLIMLSMINLYFYMRLSYNFLFIFSTTHMTMNKPIKFFFLQIIFLFAPLIMVMM